MSSEEHQCILGRGFEFKTKPNSIHYWSIAKWSVLLQSHDNLRTKWHQWQNVITHHPQYSTCSPYPKQKSQWHVIHEHSYQHAPLGVTNMSNLEVSDNQDTLKVLMLVIFPRPMQTTKHITKHHQSVSLVEQTYLYSMYYVCMQLKHALLPVIFYAYLVHKYPCSTNMSYKYQEDLKCLRGTPA